MEIQYRYKRSRKNKNNNNDPKKRRCFYLICSTARKYTIYKLRKILVQHNLIAAQTKNLDGQTDKQTGRQAGRQAGRQTDRQIDDIQRDEHTCTMRFQYGLKHYRAGL